MKEVLRLLASTNQKGNDGLFKQLDTAIIMIDTLSQRINRAALGYSGMWDSIRIREAELDSLYSYDLGLLEKAEDLVRTTKNLLQTRSFLDAKQSIDRVEAIRSLITEIGQQLSQRTGLLEGLR